MKWLSCFGVLAACGSNPQQPSTRVANTTPQAASVARGSELVEHSFTDAESGEARRLWIGIDRISHVDTHDPCCGVAYDGNRYDDALATCAQAEDDCGPEKAAVYPGLADDRVCGEKRRCVPLPLARLIVRDATPAKAVDAAERPLAKGADASVAYGAVELGREGLVYVTIADRTERIALDYGARYTITVGGGRVERVERD